MTVDHSSLNYARIEAAIKFLRANFRQQPSLDEVAAQVNLSPHHLQRLFTEWAGVSPKKFLQYISVEYAKQALKTKEANLFDAAYETGLSGTGRLHDLFVNIEGMTPGEYKNGGENLSIRYSFATTPFGKVIIASTTKGICHMAFTGDEAESVKALQNQFPNALMATGTDPLQQQALSIFSLDWSQVQELKLHLKGTPFQLKVWKTLLEIPFGQLATYGNLAAKIGKPSASRAVGTAIGRNPIAFLIPCHRVIQSSGATGEYMWGTARKSAMIGWEAAKTDIHL